MTTILLCGKMNDTSFRDALLPALSEFGSGIYYNSQSLFLFGKGEPDYLILDSEKIPEIKIENGILLFKNSFDSQEPAHVPVGFSCILESKNFHAAAILQETGAAAITCGTSSKDTISIAGLEENNAVLSLQRSVMTINGDLVEPHDFKVTVHSGIGPHRILAVCTVLLILGIDSSAGYSI
ncbi:MAG TPA: hypothetical protein VHO71_06770 [Caproiciproducens sp.]|nr:hypothetical protein [Caproiciproducens sp.]